MSSRSSRQFDFADNIISILDTGLRTLLNNPAVTERSNPADVHAVTEIDDQQKKHVAGLMRVNHCGEVCAQGLYQGQSFTARDPEVREKMQQSAVEENDHLSWTADRIHQMGSHTSLLNPLFYFGSMAIGTIAGIAGDRWSLGFVAETERQVVRHLDGHLDKIEDTDEKSRSILQQMREDELEHATKAVESGAAELPEDIQKMMKATAKLMTKTTYWI